MYIGPQSVRTEIKQKKVQTSIDRRLSSVFRNTCSWVQIKKKDRKSFILSINFHSILNNTLQFLAFNSNFVHFNMMHYYIF